MINTKQARAIIEIYPQVVTVHGDIAYDNNANEVTYDIDAVNAKVESDAQSQENARQSAHDKLAALGLTEEEIAALGK